MPSQTDSDWAVLKGRILSQKLPADLKARPIVIFCAGDRGKHALFTLRDRGYNVVGFCDNSPQKQGTTFHGLRVCSPKQLHEILGVFTVVAIETLEAQAAVLEQLKTLGVPASSIGAVVYPDVMERIDRVYQSLSFDERSRQVLLHYLLAHFEQDSRYFRAIQDDRQYFCLDLLAKRPSDGEVFIDAGAYTGDTMESFVQETRGSFEKIISFEPTASLYAAVKDRASRLGSTWNIPASRFVVVNGGVGDQDCVMPLIMKDSDPHGAGNSFYDIAERSGEEVPVHAIDSYLAGSKATFIKADIEGFELNMLKGAKDTITRYRPDLAICLYHKTADIYEIPEYILSLVPEYKLYLRHHLHDYSETVLYCTTQ